MQLACGFLTGRDEQIMGVCLRLDKATIFNSQCIVFTIYKF